MKTCKIFNLIGRLSRYEDYVAENQFYVQANNNQEKKESLMNYSENCDSNFSEIWLNKLPNFLVMMIFRYLSNTDRIHFAQCYPQFINTILRPQVWKSFSICLKKDIISLKELNWLLIYLNVNIVKLNVCFNDYNFTTLTLERIFQHVPYLVELTLNAYNLSELEPITDIVCRLRLLRNLNLSWKHLHNDHLINIVDKLVHLHSIELSTNNDIRLGLKYLALKSKPLKKFGLSQYKLILDVETLLKIYKTSKDSLVSLSLSSMKKVECHSISVIELFINLKVLYLRNIEHPNQNFSFFEMENLKTLDIRFDTSSFNFIPKTLSFYFNWLFNLQKIYLQDVMILGDEIKYMGMRSPNLVELTFNKCDVSETGLIESLQYLTKLKSFCYIEDYRNVFVTFDFLRQVPHNLLNSIETILIFVCANSDKNLSGIVDAFEPLSKIRLINSKLFNHDELIIDSQRIQRIFED